MITTTLPPVIGGLENHVWELSRRLVRQGHSVTLIGSRNYQKRIFPDREEKEGVHIYRVWDTILPLYYFRYRLFFLRAARLVRRLHQVSSFELVHAHQIYPAGVAGALLQYFLKIPLVITCHGSALFLNWEVPWIRPLMKWTLKRTWGVIAVGGELKEKLFTGKVAPSRVAVMPNCVDTKKFTPGSKGKRIRKKYGWRPEDTVIAFIGRFHPVKGPQYFIRMALKLIGERADLKFLLVGTGELESQLRREVSESPQPSAFAFTGEIDHDALPPYLDTVDILVMPSLAEGSPLLPLEAMAMKKAIVANRVGGLTDLIADGETGLLVKLDSARSIHHDYGLGEDYLQTLTATVKKLISDLPLRQILGENARRSAQAHYSWEAYLEKLLPLYENAVQKS